MLKSEIKRLAIFLMLLHVFLIKTDYTDADIFAERIVSRNKFSAITLDFSARNSFNNSSVTNLFSLLGMQPEGFDLRAVKIKVETGNDFKYRLKTIKTNGDDFFCNHLRIKVFNRNFLEIFSGSLTDLLVTSKFVNFDPKDFIFFLSLEEQDPALKNKICEFNLDFKTYREDPNEQGGIFAQRLIGNVVSSGNW